MRYHAFISYASADRAVGERFQRAIEHYRVPRPLRGADRGFGAVPKRLSPLFRDRSDARAGRDLGQTLHEALAASDALVVLCSPASARSKWVNEEIRAFRRLGRDARIFPVLVTGHSCRFDPDAAPQGAFAPALFERIDAGGARLAAEDASPLAPDLREGGDGEHLARLKIVAAITGIPLTELTQRQHEAERRERRVVRAVAAALAALAIAASGAAVAAWRSAEAARQRLESAIEMAARRVDDAVRFNDAYGVPTAVVAQLLEGAERDFAELIDARATDTPGLTLQRARLSTLFADLQGAVGDRARQLRSAREALRAAEAVPVARSWSEPRTWFARLPAPRDAVEQRLAALQALAVALDGDAATQAESERTLERGRALAASARQPRYLARFWALIGERRYRAGDPAAALAAQDTAEATLAADTRAGDAASGYELATVRSDRAEMLLELERHGEALRDQSAATDYFDRRAAAAPDDALAQRNLGQALVRLGDMRYAASGDWRASLPQLERAGAILRRISAADPARLDFARDYAIALERLGDARLQLGEADAAAAAYARGIALRRDLLERAPDRPDAARDVAVGLERIGDLELARRRPQPALAALDEARGLRERESAQGEHDRVGERDLAVLWHKTALARAMAGGAQDWSGAHREAIGRMRALAEAADAPSGWLRDLAVLRNGYAEALRDHGERRAAQEQWRLALALIERQRALSPDDPRLREDERALRGALASAR